MVFQSAPKYPAKNLNNAASKPANQRVYQIFDARVYVAQPIQRWATNGKVIRSRRPTTQLLYQLHLLGIVNTKAKHNLATAFLFAQWRTEKVNASLAKL
jgi:hypothetical protein